MRSPAPLPNFLVIGAAKSGTTTLYRALRQHPEVFMSPVKEPAFFSNPREFERGLNYYRTTYFAGAGGERAIGEATPWYLTVEGCIERLRSHLPDPSHRFIAILRDPTERAYSMYWDQVHGGRESRSFEEALEAEMSRATLPASQPECVQAYVRSGRYEVYLKRYIEAFGRERLLVLLHDDLRAPQSRRELMSRMAEFLGVSVDPLFEEVEARNVGRAARSVRLARWLDPPPGESQTLSRRLAAAIVPRGIGRKVAATLSKVNRTSRSRPPLSSEAEDRLRRYFDPTVGFVEELLDRDLSRWRTRSIPDRR